MYMLMHMFVLNVCVFIRRKSKQALRDYKKVQIQLENLETSVRDRCKKEFTGNLCTMYTVYTCIVMLAEPML